jgi:class 3 adenylate cyclase
MAGQLAAVMVTDLVGSTETRVRIGEDAAEALRRTHDQMLRAEINENNGVFVKSLGDGVLAYFLGASDAIAAAIAIQQCADRHSIEYPDEPLDVRVGIAAGDVTVENDDVFGTPVVEASRLCASATGGQIVVADLVRVLGRGRGGHTFTPIGELELKGLPEPVVASEVGWERTARSEDRDLDISAPMPGPLAGAGRFPYAGRTAARELLADRWKESCVETRRIVLLAGEPGIGKTRLVSEVARTVHDDGALVLLGRCFEELSAPYAPWAEALRHLVLHAPIEMLEAHVAHAGGDLDRLVPELGRRLGGALPDAPTGDAELARMRLFDSVVDLLVRTTQRVPTLLVLDDLHWADASSVELLMWVSRAGVPMRLAIFGTYRDTDVARSHPFAAALADLRRIPGVDRVPLDGLDESEVLSFMESAGGHALEDEGRELAALLWHETEGNPFFLQEVLLHLAESGAIVQDGGRWTATRSISEAGVPEGVRDVIGRRLSVLDDATNDVLRAASILGLEFDLGLLGALTDRDALSLLDVLEEPTQRGLLVESGVDRYRFAHGLIRQTLDEELPAGRRARLHRRAADAILATPGSSDAMLARHLIAAGPLGDPTLAADAAERAANEAFDNLAWEQAASWYRSALDQSELIDDDAVRAARLHVGLGCTLNSTQASLEARVHFREAFAAAQRADDLDLMLAAAVGYGGARAPWLEYGDREGIAMLEEVGGRVAADDLACHATFATRIALWHQLDPGDLAGEHALRAVALARESGDSTVLAEALRTAIIVGAYRSDATELDARSAEAVELAREVGNVSLVCATMMDRSTALATLGRLADAARITLDCFQFATDVGSGFRYEAAWHLNQFEFMGGRIDVFRRRLAELLAEERVSAGHDVIMFGQQLELADVTEPLRAIDLWVETDAGHNPFVFVFPWRAANAAWEGRGDDARAELAAWRNDVYPSIPGFVADYASTWAARVAWWSNDAETAELLYDALLPCRGLWAYAGGAAICPVENALGQCAFLRDDPELAVAHFEAALEQTAREGWVMQQLEAELLLAIALAAMGRVDDARAHDAVGRELAERCNAPAYLTRRALAPYFDPTEGTLTS